MSAIIDFLVPREKKFLSMLDDAAENAQRGALAFSEFISEFPKLNKSQKKEYLNKIEEIEHRGDKIIHVINARLNSVFITPLDKEDIHELAGLIDDLIDLIYSTTKQIVLYELKNTDKCIGDLTALITEGIKEVRQLVDHLKKIKYSEHHGVKIHDLENQADDIYEKAMAELYAKKKDAAELIKLKDIYFNLELVTDKMEDISVVIQNIVLKHG